MGQAQSVVKRADPVARYRCARKPKYVDDRGFALSVVYRVPQRLLDMYPPTVYSLEHARQDIAACAAGQPLPNAHRVVRFDRVTRGMDPRVYALMQFHGYEPRDFQDGQLLQTLPYSVKDAQIDISSVVKTGRPYYVINRYTSRVMDPKRGQVRNWRHKGFYDGYQYNAYNPRAVTRQLGASRPALKFDPSKYPLVTGANGRWVRTIPCSVMPSMCRPGQEFFPYYDGDGNGAGSSAKKGNGAKALALSKAKKAAQVALQQGHSRAMEQLRLRMKELNPNSDNYRKLRAQRDKMRNEFRKARGARGTPKLI
jgi:hypothetical protein